MSDRYMQPKKLWDEGNKHHSEILLEMSRAQLRMVTNLVTGNNTFGSHMVRLGIANDDNCRWCREAVEDSYHFLCESLALSKPLVTFGVHQVDEMDRLGIIKKSAGEEECLRNHNGPILSLWTSVYIRNGVIIINLT